MQSGQASWTAEVMALFRALESARPAADRLFEDPFAPLFLRPSLRSVLRLSQRPAARRLILRFLDSRWPGARSSGVARTRLIDDWLRAALADGAAQVVILGAGFDCRAYRLPEVRRARVATSAVAGR
jgi:methyltransferase (TIGR00027 family)